MYDRIKSIYHFELNESMSIEGNQSARKKSLKQLGIFFKSLRALKSSGNIMSKLPELLKAISDKQVNVKVKSLVEDMTDCRDGLEEDWNLLHCAGCTSDGDDSSLPNHPSSDLEISTLVKQFSSLLDCLPRPMIVTLARSSLDDYCPPSKVEQVQNLVVEQLHDKYQIIRMYEEYAC